MPTKHKTEARCIALFGPHLSGKTTLLESILIACEAVRRQNIWRRSERNLVEHRP